MAMSPGQHGIAQQLQQLNQQMRMQQLSQFQLQWQLLHGMQMPMPSMPMTCMPMFSGQMHSMQMPMAMSGMPQGLPLISPPGKRPMWFGGAVPLNEAISSDSSGSGQEEPSAKKSE